jgi:D-glycero-D-manno-heptose 1,7-bisphosphate phosphatase
VTPEATAGRLLLLDRDGVIFEHVDPYILSWDDVRYAAGALETIAAAWHRGWTPVVVTNQSPVGRGLVPASFVEAVNERLRADARDHGAELDHVLVCPHAPGDGCACRKPKPELAVRAGAMTGLPLSTAWMVGDSRTDIAFAAAAGVARAFHVCTGADPGACGTGGATCIGGLAGLREHLDA